MKMTHSNNPCVGEGEPILNADNVKQEAFHSNKVKKATFN